MTILRRPQWPRSGRSLWLCAALALFGQNAAGEEYRLGADRESAETLTVYSTADYAAFEPVLLRFAAREPQLHIRYFDLDSVTLYRRLRGDEPGQRADLALSTAMDLQLKLANDGFARAYRSANTAALPRWANWRFEAFGVTAEPAVTVYNPALLPAAQRPRNRAELTALLTAPDSPLFGQALSYDPERSGAGFLLATQDARRYRDFWSLAQAFGRAQVKLFSNTRAMLDRVASGRSALAYNVLGAYARTAADADPGLAILPMADYQLSLSRVALLPTDSPNPRAGERLLDFLLSADGQRGLDEALHGGSLAGRRADAGALVQPVPLGTELLVYLDQAKRRQFLSRWNRALAGGQDSAGLD